MLRILLLSAWFLTFSAQTQSQYKIITLVESVIPMGVGRSRLIENKTDLDVANFTTERTDGRRSKQGAVKRRAAKVKHFEETKLLNFFSGVGINFQNIASNDALISAKLNGLAAAGWELVFVTSGVQSAGGSSYSDLITVQDWESMLIYFFVHTIENVGHRFGQRSLFITRFVFRK